MKPIDLHSNLVQTGEVARLQHLALRQEDHGRRAAAGDAQREQVRRQELVDAPGKAHEARVDRDGGGGGDGTGSGSERRDRERRDAGGPSEEGAKGRYLDVRV